MTKNNKRVAFYAITNLQLVNVTNIRLSYYSENSAVLFIRIANQISYDLVKAIAEEDFFEDIVLIQYPILNNKVGFWGKIPKIRMLSYGKRMQSYHDYYLESCKTDQLFDVAVVPYFWFHTLYYLTYWKKNNRHIRIEFFEEGLSNYSAEHGTFRDFTSPRCSGSKLERRVQRFAEKPRMRRIRSNATNTLYVYNADMLYEGHSWKAKTLPSIKNNDRLLSLLDMAVRRNSLKVLRYSKKKVYYIANHLIPDIEDSYDLSYMIIDKVLRAFDPRQVLIKTHPAITEHREKYARQFEERCYIDRDDQFIEGFFADREEIESKLFILRCSALPFNMRNWFECQPFVMFTYKMFPYFSQTGDPSVEGYVAKLKQAYDDPSKIMTPASWIELEMMLESCKRRMYGLSENFQDE